MLSCFITAGILIFSSDKLKGGFDKDTNVYGISLLLASVILDGIIATEQDEAIKAQKRDFAFHSMFYNNVIMLIGNAIVFSVTSLVYVDESTLPINKFFDKEDASCPINDKLI